jgi:flagellar assembly factor FliW
LLQSTLMPRIQTKFFGNRECDPESVYSFPSGLPGFEEQRSFFFLTMPGSEPLLFMQSMTTSSLCFVLLPILVVDPAYDLLLTPEEIAHLQLRPDAAPRIGEDILCAVMVCSEGGATPTVNMMSPVIVNLKARTGLQVIHGDSGYSHRHLLHLEEELVSC